MTISTLVHWTFGFLAAPARTKNEIRLKFQFSSKYTWNCLLIKYESTDVDFQLFARREQFAWFKTNLSN